MPSAKSEPMPTADFTRASSPSPASVTPKCNGNAMPSLAMASTSRRTVVVITTTFEALMLITTSLKPSATQMRRNSIALSTMPAGVSP